MIKKKRAAVMVIIEAKTDSLILTLRPTSLKHHPGEACFPGGGWQRADKDLLQTGLRELKEELGITPDRLSSIAAMKPESTLTGYMIYPWLTTIPTLHPYTLDRQEVAEVFTIPMTEVCQESNYQTIQVEREGMVLSSLQFINGNYFIWGATARIMRQLGS